MTPTEITAALETAANTQLPLVDRYAAQAAIFGEVAAEHLVIDALGLDLDGYLRLRRSELGLPRISRGAKNAAWAALVATESRISAMRDRNRARGAGILAQELAGAL